MIFGPGFPLAGEERAKARVMNRDSKFLESPPSQRHQELPTSRQSQQFGVVLQFFGGAHHAFFFENPWIYGLRAGTTLRQ
jgi:hypothetical protein